MLEIGVAKADITVVQPEIGMLGYGLPTQRVAGVAAPLFARAFVIRDPAARTHLAFVCADLCFISQSIRQGVLARLARDHASLDLGEDNVMLSATHTHSGPGGYSHYLFYTFPDSGYCDRVYRGIVDGIVDALVRAHQALAPGRVYVSSMDLPLSEDVAYNRSIEAYNRNRDVTPVAKSDGARATDRRMTLLRMDGARGEKLGALSFFPVHATSIHSDNDLIHPDNKGLAAEMLERHAASEWRAPTFVAAFAQGAEGDVTPNFRVDRARGLLVGASDDDFESAAMNAAIQCRYAVQLFDKAPSTEEITGGLAGRVSYVDFSCAEVDPEFAGGRSGVRTTPAVVGFGMLQGTAEGPGPLHGFTTLLGAVKGLQRVRRGWARSVPKGEQPDVKLPFVETGKGARGKLLELVSMRDPEVSLGIVSVRWLQSIAERGGVGEAPWTPPVLPVQVFTLARLAIVAVPGEPTTVAGRRLSRVVLDALARRGVRQAVVCGLSNAYAGYMTTPEEYDVQAYEGACTQFGPYTLPAFQTELARVCVELAGGSPRRASEPVPYQFTPEELAKRAFQPANGEGDRVRALEHGLA